MCIPIGTTGVCVPPPVCPICNGSIISVIHGLWISFYSLTASAVFGMYFAFKEKVKNIFYKFELYLF